MAVLVLAMPAAAQAQSARTWSAGQPVDVATTAAGSGGRLTSVSCPSASQCTGVDRVGVEVTFDPSGAGTPTSAAIAETPFGSDSGNMLEGISCPTTHQCTAVTFRGFELTFDPGDPGDVQAVELLDEGDSGLPAAITCTSTTQCVMVAGQAEVDFDPQAPGDAKQFTVDSTADGALIGVSCVSADQCTSLDEGGDVVTFTPATGATTSAATNVVSSGGAISCVNEADACIAVGANGTTASFSAGHPSGDTTGSLNTYVDGVSCQLSGSAIQCVAVGSDAVTVFNPTSGHHTTTTVDSGSSLIGVDCTSTTQCTAADLDGGQVTFNPQVSLSPTREVVDAGAPTTLLACSSTSQCTSLDSGGVEVTFNPAAPQPATLASGSLAAGPPVSLSCPSTSQCTAVDLYGNAITFNPLSPAGATVTSVDAQNFDLASLACPTTTQCTATESGGEITFNPQNPGSPTLVPMGGGTALGAVACPSATQCTAEAGFDEMTFNPQAPGSPTKEAVDTNFPEALTCASVTECTTTDLGGGEATFNPQNPGTPGPVTVDTLSFTDLSSSGTDGLGTATQGATLVSVSCPTTTDCIAADASGNVVEGDPTGSGAWATTHLSNTSGLVAVACPDSSLCVALDGSGDISVGQSPAAPTSSGTPTSTGTPTNTGTPINTGAGAGSTGSTGSTGTTHGAGATGPSASAITHALKRLLAGLTGKPARLGVVLGHRGFVYSVSAPSAGTLTIEWHARVRGRVELIAAVAVTFAKARTAKVTLKLTKLGIAALKTPHLASLTLTESASFITAGSKPVSATEVVALKRR